MFIWHSISPIPGLDLADLVTYAGEIMSQDAGRKAFTNLSKIKDYQEVFSAIEKVECILQH